MGTYESFISAKRHSGSEHGFDPVFIPDCAFDFQREIISRAVRKGRVGVELKDSYYKQAVINLGHASRRFDADESYQESLFAEIAE